MRSPGRNAGLHGTFGDIGDGEKAQEKERFVAGVAGHVLLAGRDQESIARLERVFATVSESRAFAGQDIDAFFMVGMLMTAAERFAGLGHGNLSEPQRDTERAFLTRDDLQRFATGKSKFLGLRLGENARHQRTLLHGLISATPHWSLSSCLKISADCLAMASATSISPPSSIFTAGTSASAR